MGEYHKTLQKQISAQNLKEEIFLHKENKAYF